ncbi:tRNA-His guanylyltransferase [Coemansia sp. Benny D115]|nr:tRNA-His guanylyltransferase [Coemansia sp. Benny D115]
MSQKDAEKRLSGTLSSDKNELLFSEFGINYNDEKEIFKKGSVVIRDKVLVDVTIDGKVVQKPKPVVAVVHKDIIKDAFWKEHPEILQGKLTRGEKRKQHADKESAAKQETE